MDVELIEFGPLSESQRVELEGDEVDPWSAAGNRLSWRPKEQHVGLRGPDGRLVASAGLVLAEIEVDGAAVIPVVGLGGVIVAAAHRGQGLASRVLTEAIARAATMGPALMILFCHRDRAGLYARHGFTEVRPPVLVDQPGGRAEMTQVTMWRALQDGGTLPEGSVSVRGLPF
jgi:GNAT superfamily N-acetyltransferase